MPQFQKFGTQLPSDNPNNPGMITYGAVNPQGTGQVQVFQPEKSKMAQLRDAQKLRQNKIINGPLPAVDKSQIASQPATPAAPDTSVADFQESLKGMTKAYQDSFKQIKEQLGGQADSFEKQMAAVQKQTKMRVDVERPEFQQAILEAQKQGTSDFTPILNQYRKYQSPMDVYQVEPNKPESFNKFYEALTPEQKKLGAGLTNDQLLERFGSEVKGAEGINFRAKQEMPEAPQPKISAEPAGAPLPSSAGVSVTPADLPENKMKKTIEDLTKLPIADLEQKMLTLDWSNMTSGQALQAMLIYQLGEINDPATSNYLAKMTTRATEGFNQATLLAGREISEINKAISGQDFTPTTFASLSAKVLKDSKDMQIESITAEKDYKQRQYDNWLSGEQDKRGRLEGYLKAKLYATGAQDSSAGLQTMAIAVNAADLRLQQAKSEYQYGIDTLNRESRKVMIDYTNGIVQLNIDAASKQKQASAKLDEDLLKIEGLQVQDEREKRKLSLEAFSNFNDKLYKIEQDKKAEEWKKKEFNQRETENIIDRSFKLAGLTGTIWTQDDKGNLQDSGIPTFDNTKWGTGYALDLKKFQQTANNDNFNQAMKWLDSYGSSAAPSVEKLLQLQPGSLQGIKTIEEMKAEVQIQKDRAELVLKNFEIDEKQAEKQSLDAYANMDTLVNKNGIGNPAPTGSIFWDVLNKLKATITTPYGGITKFEHAHNGWDIVFPNGIVPALSDGVVMDFKQNNGGYGNSLYVMDTNGDIFQYSHLAASHAEIGEKVSPGEDIAQQGHTGAAYSTHGGSGDHLDYRKVGNVFAYALGNKKTKDEVKAIMEGNITSQSQVSKEALPDILNRLSFAIDWTDKLGMTDSRIENAKEFLSNAKSGEDDSELLSLLTKESEGEQLSEHEKARLEAYKKKSKLVVDPIEAAIQQSLEGLSSGLNQ